MASRAGRRGLLALLFASIGVLGCGGMAGGGAAWVPPGTPEARGDLVLTREGADFDRQYLKPDVDFSHYRAIHVKPLQLVYSEPFQRDQRFERSWSERKTPEQRIEQYEQVAVTRLRSLFRRSLERELVEQSGYVLAEAPGPDVLTLVAAVLDLDLRPARAEYVEAGSTSWSGPPLVVVAADLRDGATDTLLADLLQADRSGDASLDSTRFYWSFVADSLNRWAADLRVLLHRRSPALRSGE